jgi:hypothetical protein
MDPGHGEVHAYYERDEERDRLDALCTSADRSRGLW